MAELNESTPRRGTRVRKPTGKALENNYVKKLARSGLFEDLSFSSESISDEEFLEIQEHETPSVIQNANNAQGEKIFHFEGRKTKRGLLDKVRELHELVKQKTPQAHRSKIKKAIEQDLQSDLESGNDPFSDSGSEYQCSNESSESEEENSHESVNSDSSENEENVKNTIKNTSNISKNMRIIKARVATKNKKYALNTDDYFCNQASKKIVTSNHTLEKLETPRLAQDQIQKLLKNMKLSEHHQQCMKKLYQQNKSMFTKWLYVLHENFSILVYGLGSKRKLIEEFCNEFLQNSPVIVVNGFFPSLSIKDILDGIITNLLELKRNPANLYESCDIIEHEFGLIYDTHLYLIIHNIDGEMLRNNKAQNVLARLAAVRNIHLIASIDHINAPLIWDHSKLSKFNYTWWDMTSYLPYIDETSFESSMMIQKSGEFALSSLRNVFVSLTTNSKGIYLTIVKHQLKNSKNQYYQGLAFKDLYSSCREAFLVSSDLALRAQLTEFVDHKMVKFKRSLDGVEHLVIPIANTLLQKFLDEHSTS